MFIDIVKEIGTDNRMERITLHQMAKYFEENLPHSLYLNHYELSNKYGFEPHQWSYFLKIKEIDRLVQSEIAQIAEISARAALKKLQSGYAASSDIQAAKELLANSKLLRQKQNQRPQIIMTRIPAKIEGD